MPIINLYDSINSIPKIYHDHIFIFAGKSSLVRSDINEVVTEIFCKFYVDSNTISFLLNGDQEKIRFEKAILWSMKYAKKNNIKYIYCAYELTRKLRLEEIYETCSPNNFIDCRSKLKLKLISNFTRHANMMQNQSGNHI